MYRILLSIALSFAAAEVSAAPPLTDSSTEPVQVHNAAHSSTRVRYETPENRYVYERVALQRDDARPAERPKERDTVAVKESATAVYDGAHIEFEETTHDFGHVARRGGDLTAEFEYVNDGTEPLVITRITTSCTCIKPQFIKRPLAVGERGVIRLVYEPHKMEAGAFHKVIQVHTNSVGGIRLLTVQGYSVNGRKL